MACKVCVLLQQEPGKTTKEDIPPLALKINKHFNAAYLETNGCCIKVPRKCRILCEKHNPTNAYTDLRAFLEVESELYRNVAQKNMGYQQYCNKIHIATNHTQNMGSVGESVHRITFSIMATQEDLCDKRLLPLAKAIDERSKRKRFDDKWYGDPPRPLEIWRVGYRKDNTQNDNIVLYYNQDDECLVLQIGDIDFYLNIVDGALEGQIFETNNLEYLQGQAGQTERYPPFQLDLDSLKGQKDLKEFIEMEPEGAKINTSLDDISRIKKMIEENYES